MLNLLLNLRLNSLVTQKICKLLGMPAVDFEKALLKPRIKVGREFVQKSQNQDQVNLHNEFTFLPLSIFLIDKYIIAIVSLIPNTDTTRVIFEM